jgi:uncharacterized protein YkwD
VPRGLYPLSALMMLPALIAGGLYLARTPAASTSARAQGVVTAQQATGACGSAASAAGAPCAESPAYISTATIPPASAAPSRTRRPTPRPSSASSSSRPARPKPNPTRPTSPKPSTSSPTPTPTRTASPTASPSTTAPGASTAAAAVLALINQARAAAALAPLTVTAGLETSSSAHNSVMAAGCGLSHQCPGEPALGARETAAGVSWSAAGENIGDGGPVANTTAAITQMVVTLTQDMLNEKPPDDGHRLNILSTSFTHIGIAVLRSSSGTVWLTQDFSS